MDEQQIYNMQAGAMRSSTELQETQRDLLVEERNSSLIKEQLDLTEELERIDNLLRGRYQEREKGRLIWKEPTEPENIVLTEAGVQFVKTSISWIINKNTLLSNYDEQTINNKMEDYATSLSDALFMRSEIYFKKPDYEECIKVLERRIDDKVNKQIAIGKLRGEDLDRKKIYYASLNELELEYELEKTRESLMKDRLKGFEHLMRVIQDSVHSTYLRALSGQERRSLRQHMHVSESTNAGQKEKPKQMNPFNWGKK